MYYWIKNKYKFINTVKYVKFYEFTSLKNKKWAIMGMGAPPSF